MQADEIEDLGDGNVSELPLFRPDSRELKRSGYYNVESATVSPLHPGLADDGATTPDAYQAQITLERAGSRGADLRRVQSAPRDINNVVGTSGEPEIAIPFQAESPRWVNPQTNDSVPINTGNPVATERGNILVIEIDNGQAAVGTDRPALVYDVPYELDAKPGVRVFDTRGQGNKFGGGTRQWATVFSSTHDVSSPIVLGNGIYRIRLAPVASTGGFGEIIIEEFNTASGYSNVASSASTATDLIQVDLSHVGLSRASARIEFADGSAGRVDVGGAGKPLLSGNVPSDVVSDLQGEIETWPQAPGEERTLFARSRLR
jgi:hypothetical protein